MDKWIPIILPVVTAVIGWASKSLFGRYVENANTKKFLQAEIDALYAKLNVSYKEQLQRTIKINELISQVDKKDQQIAELQKELNALRDEKDNSGS